METETNRTTHSCDCTVCNGLSFTAPAGYISGTAKEQRDMIHSYAQHAHSPSPLSKVLATRAGIVPA